MIDKLYWFCFGSNVMWMLDALLPASNPHWLVVTMGVVVGWTAFIEVAQWGAKKYLARRYGRRG
jgi:hypothetical protein